MAATRRPQPMNKSVGFLLSLLILFSLPPGTAAAAPAYSGDTSLGGVNLNHYCSQTFGRGYKSVLIGTTAGDWRCEERKAKVLKSISVQDACRLQYGRTDLLAKALNWNDALSWRCFAPGKAKG
jgi:hypothetical protein